MVSNWPNCDVDNHAPTGQSDSLFAFKRLIKLSSLGVVFGVSILGLYKLVGHTFNAGKQDVVALSWPSEISGLSKNTTTVALFYHPKCPCTRATIRSIERMIAPLKNSPQIIAFAYCPGTQTESWIASETSSKLTAMGAQVNVDTDGVAARAFGVHESGHLLVYDSHQNLIFSGGVTPSRGHEGECYAGLQAIRCIDGNCTSLSQRPVFGCSIIERDFE